MNLSRTGRFCGAFTLIELIGVLAVVAILAALLLPVLIRQMDRIVGEQEGATLKAFGDALQQRVQRTRRIPTVSSLDWATEIATELGVNVSNVTTNGRKHPRYFLVDTNLSIGGAGLPYQQANAGSATQPVNVRMILVSSVGQRMTNMASGYPSAADFNAIWNWNDTTSTPPSASLLSGFTRGDDFKVQRIDLTPLFVRLVLTTYASIGIPRYSIDSTNCATAPTNFPADAYYLQGSVLSLYNGQACPGALDSQQILISGNSFVYNQDVWRASIIGGATIGGLDVATVVDRFLKAPPNLNPNVPYGTNQQRVVVTNMMFFMAKYNDWAASGHANATLKAAAVAAQGNMMDRVRQLYEPGGGGNDYTPVNLTPCVAP